MPVGHDHHQLVHLAFMHQQILVVDLAFDDAEIEFIVLDHVHDFIGVRLVQAYHHFRELLLELADQKR